MSSHGHCRKEAHVARRTAKAYGRVKGAKKTYTYVCAAAALDRKRAGSADLAFPLIMFERVQQHFECRVAGVD